MNSPQALFFNTIGRIIHSSTMPTNRVNFKLSALSILVSSNPTKYQIHRISQLKNQIFEVAIFRISFGCRHSELKIKIIDFIRRTQRTLEYFRGLQRIRYQSMQLNRRILGRLQPTPNTNDHLTAHTISITVFPNVRRYPAKSSERDPHFGLYTRTKGSCCYVLLGTERFCSTFESQISPADCRNTCEQDLPLQTIGTLRSHLPKFIMRKAIACCPTDSSNCNDSQSDSKRQKVTAHLSSPYCWALKAYSHNAATGKD